MKIYTVAKGTTGFDGLKRGERDKPNAGPGQALVRLRAASLNFRDLAIVSGKYIRGPITRDTIPLSDGAGEVVAVGAGVRSLKVGDRVVATFTQGRPPEALGSPLDGVLAEFAAFHEDGLLKIPAHMSFEEAATLPCAGVTAWNALMHGKILRAGETVLTLGTGGVSIFARQLGADFGVNYKQHPDWEKKVLELTDGQGADHVVDLGGVGTLPHSYQAVGFGGEISLIGVMTRPEGDLSPYPLMMKGATLRGIFVGAREHFEGLVRAATVNKLKPVIDRTFSFDQTVEAYQYLKSAQHFGKVVITI